MTQSDKLCLQWFAIIILCILANFWYWCDPTFRHTGLLAGVCAGTLAFIALYAFTRMLITALYPQED